MAASHAPVGIDHLTVVPANFRPQTREPVDSDRDGSDDGSEPDRRS